jgi:hypothetical protein
MEPIMTTGHEQSDLRQLLNQLLTQVSLLQASVDTMPAAIEAAVPDPALTLGAMDQRLIQIESGLATLAQMPVRSAHDFDTLRAGITREVSRKVEDATRIEGSAWKDCEEAVIVRRTLHEQRSVTTAWSVAALLGGLVLFPVLGANMYGGSVMAAWATGHTDRWQAGQDLMQVAKPQEWNQFVAAWNEVQRQNKAVAACKGPPDPFGSAPPPCEIILPPPARQPLQ